MFNSSLGQIAYTDSAGGPPALIFVHGLPTAKELWSPVLPRLAGRARLVTFDLNGYGQSEKKPGPVSHSQRAGVLDELRAHLGLDRFVLVAHDLGASVAVEYMGRHAERVDRLVLISPPVWPDFAVPFIVRLARAPGLGEALVRLIKRPLFDFGVRQGLRHPGRLTPELTAAFAGAFEGPDGDAALLRALRWGEPRVDFADYPRIIASIRVPTLIIHGRHDPYIPLEQAVRLRDSLPGATLTVFDDGGHFLPIDVPEAVAEAISAFALGS